jgi:hypothetical protein
MFAGICLLRVSVVHVVSDTYRLYVCKEFIYLRMLFKISDLGSDNGWTDGIASTHMARGVALRGTWGRVRVQCGAERRLFTVTGSRMFRELRLTPYLHWPVQSAQRVLFAFLSPTLYLNLPESSFIQQLNYILLTIIIDLSIPSLTTQICPSALGLQELFGASMYAQSCINTVF